MSLMLRLSVEVRARREQFFRRGRRQVPRFEFPLNPAEFVSKKLDMLACGEVEFVGQRLKLHRLEIVAPLFQVPFPVGQGGFTDLDFSG